ncbi:hypothetical protein LguiB_001757 [Lonicera macranthoides]
MDKLQWGNRKRLRCVKMRASSTSPTVGKSDADVVDGFGVKKKKITPRLDRRLGLVTTTAAAAAADNQGSHPHPLQSPNRLITTRELGMNSNRSRSGNEGGKMMLTSSSSPEKEEYYRYYTTRGSVGGLDESSSKILMEQQQPLHLQEDYNHHRISNYSSSSSAKVVWPRLFIALSSKEKEEDFMAMKGCKPPQRPKKRAKLIQKSLLAILIPPGFMVQVDDGKFVSPGAWLSDLCQERYEVREKKTSKKRPRGLKAMGSIESDSE